MNVLRAFLFPCLLFLMACGAKPAPRPDFRGVSFVGTADPVRPHQIQKLHDVHANAIALMPFAFCQEGDPEVQFNMEWQWIGERTEGIREAALLAQSESMKVMLKPQLWIGHGTYTGNLGFDSEEDWRVFEDSYRRYILHFAQLAEELQVPLFCIGTELKASVESRPNFWANLVDDVRAEYTGQLVYAANWDEASRIDLWSSLDYIGVDAYYPLSDAPSPSVDELVAGWRPWLEELDSLSNLYGKRVLFTEWGYRSVNHSAQRPWEHDLRDDGHNLEVQANAYLAVRESVGRAPWFAGGFVWKWFPEHARSGGAANNMFTPQNKPAEGVLKEWFRE